MKIVTLYVYLKLNLILLPFHFIDRKYIIFETSVLFHSILLSCLLRCNVFTLRAYNFYDRVISEIFPNCNFILAFTKCEFRKSYSLLSFWVTGSIPHSSPYCMLFGVKSMDNLVTLGAKKVIQ